jgi:hypothetical protein
MLLVLLVLLVHVVPLLTGRALAAGICASVSPATSINTCRQHTRQHCQKR